jgi:hypothetical protein
MAKKSAAPIGEEKDHARYSASGSSRWLNCPGSLALSDKAPPAPDSEYAIEGTKAHACLEFLLKNKNGGGAALAMARKTWPDDMVDHAAEAKAWILNEMHDDPGDLVCETRVDASPFTCEGQFGTLDAAIVREFGVLTVIDYKYGAGVAVEPEGDGNGNSQLVYYALGISHQYHHNFSHVELVVIQPRAYHESGETTRTFLMSMEDLLSWEDIFLEGVENTLEEDAPLESGSWCKFCPAATICPEIKEQAFRNAQVAFTDEVGLISVPEPVMIKLPHLSTILDATYKMEAWIAKVRDHAFHVLKRGEEIDGFKIVEKKSIRKWKDYESAAEDADLYYGAEAFTAPKLLSPAQFEKRFKASDFVMANTTKESSGVTMVRESDKRPAVRSIQDVFDIPVEVIRSEVTRTKPKRKGR